MIRRATVVGSFLFGVCVGVAVAIVYGGFA